MSHQASGTWHSWKGAVWQVHGCLWAQAYARVTLTLSQREASLQISNSGGERSQHLFTKGCYLENAGYLSGGDFKSDLLSTDPP